MCGIDNRRYYALANCLEEEMLLPLLAGSGTSLDGRSTGNSGYSSASLYSRSRPGAEFRLRESGHSRARSGHLPWCLPLLFIEVLVRSHAAEFCAGPAAFRPWPATSATLRLRLS